MVVCLELILTKFSNLSKVKKYYDSIIQMIRSPESVQIFSSWSGSLNNSVLFTSDGLSCACVYNASVWQSPMCYIPRVIGDNRGMLQKISFNLLISHLCPIHPSKQIHVYLSIPSTQTPPFRHGSESHSSISAEWKSKETPSCKIKSYDKPDHPWIDWK